ncbi:MAG TPA: hypothetical protein VEL51_01070 [Vicinamibacterales bacterium]|nr:hypothetical protein [Vicinamibacterales bacterium]
MPAKKLSSPKKPVAGKKPIGLTSALGPKATVIVVICVMAGGIAIAARQQQSKAKTESTATMVSEVVASAAPVARAATPKVSTSISDVTVAPAARTSASPNAQHAAVTVTGCLEKTDEGFRLKDASGSAAPKSRSWKSGFLKKGAASLDVVDASHTLQLGSQVGRRVSLTGSLVDREMRVESVRRMSASCKAN